MAMLRRDQPLSNHFQTHLRSIYPNLSKWNPHVLHALTLKSQLDALREPLGFLGCPSGRNDPVRTTKWPFLRKKLVLLLHLSMSANHGSTAAVMASFFGLVWTSGQPARYTKHTTSPPILFQAGCFQASKTLSKPNIETHRLHKLSKQTTHLSSFGQQQQNFPRKRLQGIFFQASCCGCESKRSGSISKIWMISHWNEKIGCFPKNRGTPKSSILIGFSIINHPFWGIHPGS